MLLEVVCDNFVNFFFSYVFILNYLNKICVHEGERKRKEISLVCSNLD